MGQEIAEARNFGELVCKIRSKELIGAQDVKGLGIGLRGRSPLYFITSSAKAMHESAIKYK